MATLWQEVVVAVLVLASVLYASWRLMPMRRRLWILERLLPQTAGGWRSRMRQAAAADAVRGCAGCSEASAPGGHTAPGARSTPGAGSAAAAHSAPAARKLLGSRPRHE